MIMIDIIIGLVCFAIIGGALWLMFNKKETVTEVLKEVEEAVEVPATEHKEETEVKTKKPRAPKKPVAAAKPTVPKKPKTPKKAN